MIRKERKIKTAQNKLLLAVLIIAVTIFASWYTSPANGPHGGVLKKTGDYYIEMKNPENYFFAYLLDKKLKTVSNKTILADVRFFMPDSTVVDVKLMPGPDNSFTTKSIPGFTACKIIFKISDNEISASFENQVKIAEVKH